MESEPGTKVVLNVSEFSLGPHILCLRPVDADLVSAALFCRIEGAVCPTDKHISGLLVYVGESRNSYTDSNRQRTRCLATELFIHYSFTQFLPEHNSIIQGGVCHQNNEFFTAIPGDNILSTHRTQQNIREFFQNL